MEDQLYEEIRLLGREIQAINMDKDIDIYNHLSVVKEARKLVMSQYYDKNLSAHKWMMDCNPSEEKMKISFMSFVDEMLLVKQRKDIALKMIESGIEDEVISEITDFSINEIQDLKS